MVGEGVARQFAGPTVEGTAQRCHHPLTTGHGNHPCRARNSSWQRKEATLDLVVLLVWSILGDSSESSPVRPDSGGSGMKANKDLFETDSLQKKRKGCDWQAAPSMPSRIATSACGPCIAASPGLIRRDLPDNFFHVAFSELKPPPTPYLTFSKKAHRQQTTTQTSRQVQLTPSLDPRDPPSVKNHSTQFLCFFSTRKTDKMATKADAPKAQLSGLQLYSRFALAGAVCCSVTHGALTPVDVYVPVTRRRAVARGAMRPTRRRYS
jgi:hypothetical protein